MAEKKKSAPWEDEADEDEDEDEDEKDDDDGDEDEDEDDDEDEEEKKPKANPFAPKAGGTPFSKSVSRRRSGRTYADDVTVTDDVELRNITKSVVRPYMSALNDKIEILARSVLRLNNNIESNTKQLSKSLGQIDELRKSLLATPASSSTEQPLAKSLNIAGTRGDFVPSADNVFAQVGHLISKSIELVGMDEISRYNAGTLTAEEATRIVKRSQEVK